ncbi:MAG: MarR family winged helix-turn-helix transcriptional regulator [Myxococcota bacterium]
MSGSPDDDGFRVLRAIRRIVRQVSRYSRQVGRDSGLGVPQILCLRAIAEAPSDLDVTVAHVASTVHLSRSTTSILVDRLVREGLVTRERNDRDRRRVQLGLTPAGRARLDQAPAPLESRFLERLSAIDPSERASLVASLERVVDLMDAEDLDASPLLVDGADLDR